MYKDKEKQKEAILKAVHKHRGVIPEPCNTHDVIPVSYPPTDYRYYLTPPKTEGLVPEDYVNKFRSLPVDVQISILGTLEFRKFLRLHDDTKVRIDNAVNYQEWFSNRKLPNKPIFAEVR